MIKFLKSIFSKYNKNYAGSQVFTYYDPKTKKEIICIGQENSNLYFVQIAIFLLLQRNNSL